MKDGIYPVITLQQPWATWIMRRWKLIETRTHQKFKCLAGKEFLIHAGLSTDQKAAECPFLTREQLLYKPNEVLNGFILGSVYAYNYGLLTDKHSKSALIDCKETKRYGLFLDEVQPFNEPLPAKGEQGIWYYDLANKRKYPISQFQAPTLF